MHRFKDLDVWKKAMDLSESVYRLTEIFPSDEKFGLTAQIRRSAISIPSNIAEGAGRNSKGEFKQFLGISLGSLFELETQLILAARFNYLKEEELPMLSNTIESLRKMIFGLQKSLE